MHPDPTGLNMRQDALIHSTCSPVCRGEDRAAHCDAGIARMLSGPAPTPRAANARGSGPGDGPDAPLFALIEAHRTARLRLDDSVVWEDEGSPEHAEARAVYDSASDAERKAFQALFEAQPVTLVGLQAMLRYHANTPALDDEAKDFRRVMKAVATAADGIRSGAISRAPGLVLSAPCAALPLPGSEEAKAAFRAACADADQLSARRGRGTASNSPLMQARSRPPSTPASTASRPSESCAWMPRHWPRMLAPFTPLHMRTTTQRRQTRVWCQSLLCLRTRQPMLWLPSMT